MKSTVFVMLVLLSNIAYGAEYNAPEAYQEGEIHSLDFGSSTLILQGQSYDVSESAQVEINGTYGAFTMLEVGMRVAAVFRRYEDGSREIIQLTELADNHELLVR